MLDSWSSAKLDLPTTTGTQQKHSRVPQRVLTIVILLLVSSFIYLLHDAYRPANNGQGSHSPQHLPDLYEAGIVELQAGLDAGHFTSVDLVKVCIHFPLFFVEHGLSRSCRHTLVVSTK